MAYDDAEILEVLVGQSDGYLIHPNAAAFIASGYLDEGEVRASLTRLAEAGHAQEFEDVAHEPVWEPVMTIQHDEDGTVMMKDGQPVVAQETDIHGNPQVAIKVGDDGLAVHAPVLDDDGKEVIINHGFAITPEGSKVAKAARRH